MVNLLAFIWLEAYAATNTDNPFRWPAMSIRNKSGLPFQSDVAGCPRGFYQHLLFFNAITENDKDLQGFDQIIQGKRIN